MLGPQALDHQGTPSSTISKVDVKELVGKPESAVAYSHHNYHTVTQGLELRGMGSGGKKYSEPAFRT